MVCGKAGVFPRSVEKCGLLNVGKSDVCGVRVLEKVFGLFGFWRINWDD